MVLTIWVLTIGGLAYWLSLGLPLWRLTKQAMPHGTFITYKHAASTVLPVLLVVGLLWWTRPAASHDGRPVADLIREFRSSEVNDWASAAEGYRLATEIHKRMENR